MNRIVLVAASVCSLLVVDPALGAEPAAPSAAARELAQLLVSKESWSLAMKQLAESVQRDLEHHPGSKLEFPKDLQSKARAEVEAVLPYEELIGMHAKQLSASYTDAELREVSAFFRTPTGKKWLESSPKISGAVGAETQQRFAQKMPDIMTKLAHLAKAPAPSKKAPDAPKKAAEAPSNAAEPAKKAVK